MLYCYALILCSEASLGCALEFSLCFTLVRILVASPGAERSFANPQSAEAPRRSPPLLAGPRRQNPSRSSRVLTTWSAVQNPLRATKCKHDVVDRASVLGGSIRWCFRLILYPRLLLVCVHRPVPPPLRPRPPTTPPSAAGSIYTRTCDCYGLSSSVPLKC